MKTAVAAVLLPIGLFAVPAVALDATEPASVVKGFYTKYLELQPAGLPTAAQQKALAPYLSRRILGLMDAARAYQDQEAKAHPDDKPPFVDGCLFASLFEGPKAFKVGTAVADGQGFKVPVHFTYEKDVAWDDEVVVAREDGRYVIDDVILGGAGQFNPPGRLSTNLASRGE
jgi:hypothetical protein